MTTRPWALFGLAMFGAVIFTGCKDDDDEEPVVTPVEDGYYVIGAGTSFSSPSLDGAFSIARNEVRNGDYNDGTIDESDRSSFREVYAYLEAGEDISIREVAGSSTVTWGMDNVVTVTGGSEADGPQVDFWRGDLVDGGAAIQVSASGLYHIAFDTEVGIIVVIPVQWGMIGSAVGGWTNDVVLNASGGASGMTFTMTDQNMTADIWKLRNNGGWKAILDPDHDNGTGINPGVILNTNFGITNGELIAGGNDISNDMSGVYNVTLTWEPGEPFALDLDRTGDLVIDYSGTSCGLIGDALVDHADGWVTDFMPTAPTQNGTAYEWSFPDVNLNTTGGFKVREAGTWDGINIGFSAVTITGTAAAEVADASDNFSVLTGGTYDITFIIDGDDRTFNIDYD